MRRVLCFFSIILAVAVSPAVLSINSELVPIFNYFETDFFNWYRMLLVAAFGILPAVRIQKESLWVAAYAVLLALSNVASRFPETSLYGTPMHHEGFFALLGYVGIFIAAKKYGLFPELEKCLDIVVYITVFVAFLQVVYGNLLSFPLFKALISNPNITVATWPLYGNMGGPNNLGLFCALFIPYAILREKHLQAVLLIALLIGSQARGAWLSVLLTTAFISRRYLLYAALIGLILSIAMRDIVSGRIRATLHEIHYPIRDKDLDGRAYMWKRAIPMLKDSILLGEGPGTYMLYFPQFTSRGDDMGFKSLAVDRPHNMFINIWQGTGLLSLLILAIAAVNIIRQGIDPSLQMGAIGFLLAGLFTDSVLCVTPYFLIFMGGLSCRQRKNAMS